MLNSLKGKWSLDQRQNFVTVTEDVSYMDLYSHPWKGTVTVNGVEQNYSYRYSSIDYHDFLALSPDIRLYYYPPTPAISYKNKIYVSPVTWEDFKSGIINKELTFTYDNTTINIKINLQAPITALKKGVEYLVNDSRWDSDVRIDELEFLSPTRIAGYYSGGDMLTPFTGKWSSNSSHISLKIKSDFQDGEIAQTHNYIYKNNELTFYKNIEFYKINNPGTIPFDKISTVKQVLKYKRDN